MGRPFADQDLRSTLPDFLDEPLLATKLRVPPPSAWLVTRPRLLDLLAEGVQGPLTLLAAPAGAGKTMLLGSWLRSGRHPGPVAWFSLDADDNDRGRFWAYVLAGVRASGAVPTSGPVDLRDWRTWWAWVPGASWRHPEGPGSTLHGRDRHPVVQVAYEDAQAYAAWAGKTLASEAEWEYAARGGLEGKVYCWGDEFAPKGRMLANTWQGEFPWQNLLLDRYAGTSPVGAFPPNGYGFQDMAGNVWEWTSDYFTHHPDEVEHGCCVPRNPHVAAPVLQERIPRKVIKGGSHLCAPSYCLRYRPAARQGEAVDTSTGHIGFRCVVRGDGRDEDIGSELAGAAGRQGGEDHE